MSQPKVYEFAKEIGIETLALMDKIRKWDLPVKSHMAELETDVLEQIKTKLAEEQDSGKKAKKKKTAKKAVAKKATKKKATKVAKKVEAAGETPAPAPASKRKASSRKTVIRRKRGAEDEAPENQEELSETPISAASETVAEAVAVIEVAPEPEVAMVGPVAEVAPVEAAVEAAPVVEEPSKKDDKGGAARKREVLMTDEGPISGVKSDRPRRNIVGRMDLSKVKQQQQQGQRPQKTSTRNIRPGFVAAQPSYEPFEQPSESGFQHGRKDKDKKRKNMVAPAAPAMPNSKEKETLPPTFVSAEFKKREIVFQPKKKKVATGEFKKTEITMPAAHKRVVKVYGSISVGDLAQAMGIKAPILIKNLIKSGVMATMNTELDFDTVSLIVPEFKYEAENVQKSQEELIDAAAFGTTDAEMVTRSPVVTVMGHVDHGKTTLLDTIRKARVAQGEAGGITQHMGAYRVKTAHGEITFIDTPGHEAFTAMRARGANATDIVILVVAADDGVMPQTIEAINHAKAAEVPIVVAINKMDKPDANPDRIKQQLSEYELIPEDWGGTTIFAPVSALKGDGVDELLDHVSLQAEVLELKANPKRSATGIVVESRVEKGRGNVATLLVQDGTLTSGQAFVVGEIAARARQIYDETGKVIKEAGPSCPVEVIGLPASPQAGDRFDVCKDERSAQAIADTRREARLKQEAVKSSAPMALEDLFSKVKMGELKELPVVLKTDVAGTGEAIRGMFDKISTDEVKIKVIHSAVGGISESDVLLASTAGGLIVGFNTRPDSAARAAAQAKSVEIKTYSIVYELIDDMKAAMSGLLSPDVVEKALGRVEVRDTFSVPKIGTIAGCFVTEGKVNRNAQLRLVRDGKVIYTGKVSSLRRFKDDVKEVQTGYECGIGIENFNDIKVGDEIEAFVQEEVAREL